MNLRLVAVSALSIGFLSAGSQSALALDENVRADEPLATVSVLNEVVPQRAAIPFVPFPMVDPITGTALTRGATLALPDGRRVSAVAYFSELNRFERHLNSLGRSLREGQKNLGSVAALPFDSAVLTRQGAALMAQHSPVSEQLRLRLPSDDSLAAGQAGVDRRQAQLCDALRSLPENGQTPTHTERHYKPWNASYGSTSGFAVFLSSQTTSTAGLEESYSMGRDACGRDVTGPQVLTPGAHASAEGTGGFYVFGQKLDVLRATHAVHADLAGARGTTKMFVLGHQIYTRTTADRAIHLVDRNWTKSWERTGDFKFSMGPIPMAVTYGVRATANLAFSIEAAPIQATINLLPELESTAFVQGGAELVVARAGLGGDLLIIDDKLPMQVVGAVEAAASGERGVDLKVKGTVDNEMQALDGRLYAFAAINVPKGRSLPFEEREWSMDLYKWTGLKTSGRLYDFEKVYPVRF